MCVVSQRSPVPRWRRKGTKREAPLVGNLLNLSACGKSPARLLLISLDFGIFRKQSNQWNKQRFPSFSWTVALSINTETFTSASKRLNSRTPATKQVRDAVVLMPNPLKIHLDSKGAPLFQYQYAGSPRNTNAIPIRDSNGFCTSVLTKRVNTPRTKMAGTTGKPHTR